jgi:hypothetical protein
VDSCGPDSACYVRVFASDFSGDSHGGEIEFDSPGPKAMFGQGETVRAKGIRLEYLCTCAQVVLVNRSNDLRLGDA